MLTAPSGRRASTRPPCGTSSRAPACRRPSGERSIEVRYEQLTTDPGAVAEQIAAELGVSAPELGRVLAEAHPDSVGRYRDELTEAQLEEVEDEAGPLLRALGYDRR